MVTPFRHHEHEFEHLYIVYCVHASNGYRREKIIHFFFQLIPWDDWLTAAVGIHYSLSFWLLFLIISIATRAQIACLEHWWVHVYQATREGIKHKIPPNTLKFPNDLLTIERFNYALGDTNRFYFPFFSRIMETTVWCSVFFSHGIILSQLL